MGNELAELKNLNIQKYDESTLKDLVSTSYLPRLQLMTSASKVVKADKFPQNSWALVRSAEDMTDLGKSVDILICCWRPLALEIGEEVLSVYDVKSETFKKIQAKSEGKDSGCMFGPQFLVWVPSQKCFATYFAGSKSSRRDAGPLTKELPKPMTFKSRLVETKKFSWTTPAVTPCSTPFELPEGEELQKQVEKFNNPPESEVEKAEDTNEDQRAR